MTPMDYASEYREYDHKEVLDKLKEFCDRYPTRGDAAEALGVGRVFLWKVLEGQVIPTEAILEKIGFTRKRVITYKFFKEHHVVHDA